MAVEIKVGATLEACAPRVLFDARGAPEFDAGDYAKRLAILLSSLRWLIS
jgi:hypothetical protein